MEKADKPQEPKKEKFVLKPNRIDVEKSYTVKAGDTLSGIAEKFYGDAAKYQDIYEANKDLIGPSADNIKVGQELKIPPKK